MPWKDTPAKRAADARTYGTAEYKRNREAVMRRAGGRCEGCGHRHRKLQCDHVVAKSEGGGNAVSNLQALCTKEAGGCGCHEAKTYSQRGRSRPAADPECLPRTRWLPAVGKRLQESITEGYP
jgi:5-methylcytosine-specific restriction endonuclease McrA